MRKAASMLAIFLIFALEAAALPTGRASGDRIALVIGNGGYDASPLRNPPNDARDVAAALEELGFRVALLVDGDREAMEKAIRAFGSDIRAAEAGLFYYAGHGVQVRGRNYLIPVRTDIADADEVTYKAVDAELVLAKMESSGCPTSIVILDACRNNPFPGSERGAERGLAIVGRQPVGSLVVFATAPGQTAKDGEGSNGVFTKHLLRAVWTPGLDIEILMRRVRDGVREETGGSQVPWTNSSLTSAGFSFLPEEASETAGGKRSAPAGEAGATGRATSAAAAPAASFASTRGDAMVVVLASGTLYVDGFERGRVAGGNTVTIEGLRAGNVNFEMRYPDGRAEKLAATVPAGGSVEVSFKLRERVDLGIKMVPVQGGSFTMGSSEVKNAKRHKVTLDSYRISSYEITQSQYKKAMRIEALKNQSSEGDRFPVEAITWYGAIVFCNRASQLEGLEPAYFLPGYGTDPDAWPKDWTSTLGLKVQLDRSKEGYRLPTEAEWEYAARGGPKQGMTHYPGGMRFADLGWLSPNAEKHSHEVGGKEPNPLGIFDLAGNVAEQVWDWGADFSGEEQLNPAGPAAGKAPVWRGGGYNFHEDFGRVYHRIWLPPSGDKDGRLNGMKGVGIRVVRSRLE